MMQIFNLAWLPFVVDALELLCFYLKITQAVKIKQQLFYYLFFFNIFTICILHWYNYQ